MRTAVEGGTTVALGVEMRIALVRHTAPLIASGICYGRLDLPLSPAGQHHVAEIASRAELRGATHVITSPARRCRTLAGAIAAVLAVPLTDDARLLELDFGAWEGQAWDTIDRADLDRWAACPLHFAPPGGETGAALIARVSDFHAELRQRRQDCVIVSHGGPLKVLAALLIGAPVDLLADAPQLASIRIVTTG